jgi:4-aminobutyrate aminotransferase-like enzyme
VLTGGTYGSVLRILPPLVIDDADLAEALDVIEEGLGRLDA